MANKPAPLLDKSLVRKAKKVADAVRRGEIAPLVGAGISIDSGLPSWNSLIRRLVLAWQQVDKCYTAKSVDGARYFKMVTTALGTELSVVSHIRAGLEASGNDFADLVQPALYMDPHQKAFFPRPLDTHRHLVAMTTPFPNQIWTTNYDNLLEQAAEEAGIACLALHPGHRLECKDFAVSHLHGFLPPTADLIPSISKAPIVLAEDDYHLVAGDVLGWTNREFHRLFDAHRALILGMSLTDPNLRRVLRATYRRPSQARRRGSTEPRHFALMQSFSETDLNASLQGGSPAVECELEDARDWRRDYWALHDVDLIELPTYDSILPFLLRVRYESHGGESGKLWKDAAVICHRADPWRTAFQEFGRVRLENAVESICSDFQIQRNEIVEIGLFLVTGDGRELDLVFRGGGPRKAAKGKRRFSIDPDAPTGVAGHVFVTGDMVRIERSSAIYDFGLDSDGDSSTSVFEGLISVPIVDWEQNGTPLGVVYVSTSTVRGRLFALKDDIPAGGPELGLRDLYVWLQEYGLGIVRAMTL